MPTRPRDGYLERRPLPGVMRMSRRWLMLALCLSTQVGRAQGIATVPASVPADGRAVLDRMHTAYAGRWYRTLTFVQTTTIARADGSTIDQTWYESLRHAEGGRTMLRIDQGALSAGNGVIYTADSAWIVRNGAQTAARADGNFFLPLIEGVYVQPVVQTVRELGGMKIDLTKVHGRNWESRPVWVVGAAAGDTVAPQFWVDPERLVVVRVIVASAPGQPPLDVRLGGYQQVGRGWLATEITMLQGGKMRQREVYHDWKVDIPLDTRLFDPALWREATHWFKAP